MLSLGSDSCRSSCKDPSSPSRISEPWGVPSACEGRFPAIIDSALEEGILPSGLTIIGVAETEDFLKSLAAGRPTVVLLAIGHHLPRRSCNPSLVCIFCTCSNVHVVIAFLCSSLSCSRSEIGDRFRYRLSFSSFGLFRRGIHFDSPILGT